MKKCFLILTLGLMLGGLGAVWAVDPMPDCYPCDDEYPPPPPPPGAAKPAPKCALTPPYVCGL